MILLEQNLAKTSELQPFCQYAYIHWVNECFSLNHPFRVSEARRSTERQKALFRKGRNNQGQIVDARQVVTHLDGVVKKSTHQLGLAVDIYPVGFETMSFRERQEAYQHIEDVAARWGITHPFDNGSFVDLPHFEFKNAVPMPSPTVVSPEARLRGLQRRLTNTRNEMEARTLRELIKRLEKRMASHSKKESKTP